MSTFLSCLVADIGGTNARLALAEVSSAGVRLKHPLSLRCNDFLRAEDAIERYLQLIGAFSAPPAAVIAVAGPVEDGIAISTNGNWRLSEASLQRHGFASATLINDYTALALAAPQLGPDDLALVGPELMQRSDESLVVLGAGTGFGVAALARGLGGQTALATEGGHAAFAPTDDIEVDIMRLLAQRFGRVSIERLLSGPGLINLRDVLGQIGGVHPDPLSSEEIVARAVTGRDRLCVETLDRFCAIYGHVAGDIALTLGARGGVYLGGGIAPGIIEYLKASAFRQRFEAKGRFEAYLAAIPTQVILHPYAALLGSAAVFAVAAGRMQPRAWSVQSETSRL